MRRLKSSWNIKRTDLTIQCKKMKLNRNIVEWISPRRLLWLAFHLWPGREFLVFRGKRLNRQSVFAQTRALAAGLHALGIKPGDRVAVFLPACPEAIYAQFVNTHLGTIHMPLNPLLGEMELQEILRHSGAKAIITVRDWYGLQQLAVLARLKPSLPDLQTIIVLGDEAGTTGNQPSGDGIYTYAEMISSGRPYPKIKLKRSDPALLCYTSGTTGQPKGVIHSYSRNWSFSITSILRLKQEALQCLLLPYPPYHFAGMFGIASALLSGGKVVLMDRMDPSQLLTVIQAEKVTQIGAPPTIFRLLLVAAQRSSCDLSSVRRLTISSEKLIPSLARLLYETFHCRLDNFYGTTESHLISWTDQGDWQSACDTVGRPLPGVSIRVVDPDRRPLSVGELGEIAVLSPQTMDGYYRDPERTSQVMDADGWLYTGDAGFIGEDGCLRLTGRVSDIIKRGGEKIHPEEIEAFLESHPAIRHAVVIGVPNELVGENILAFIVPNPGHAIVLEDVLRFCRGKIASFKIPSEIRLIAEIPVTSNGKIQRHKLREIIHA
jgi:acyl-coenzyme A synthetase/AMP-(fatty) acid ligase